MRAVGIRELKNKLSTYIRLAEKGERILVTDRDRVVAEIRGLAESELELADVQLAALVREGILRPPLKRGPLPQRPPPSRPLAALVDDLARDRGER